MTLFDRPLKNRALPAPKPKPDFSGKGTDKKKYFVCYHAGKYVIEDLTLKKRGHSQRFK
jgi:hypothetical protein